jgi:hypothetical protein
MDNVIPFRPRPQQSAAPEPIKPGSQSDSEDDPAEYSFQLSQERSSGPVAIEAVLPAFVVTKILGVIHAAGVFNKPA